MLTSPCLGIKVFPSIQEVPAEIIPQLNATTAGNTYVLYLGNEVVGWGQILEHERNKVKYYELAYLQLQSKYRGSGYGKILTNHMLYHCAGQEIYLTTVVPGFFLKLGFIRAAEYPLKIEHSSTECQACRPAECQPLWFKKPDFLRKFGCDLPVYEEYNALLKTQKFMRSEFSTVNGYIWSCTENIYSVIIQDFMFFILFPFNENPYGVVFPYAKLTDAAIKTFLEKLRSLQITQVRFLGWPSVHRLRRVKEQYCQPVKISEDRDNFDYLYKVEDFASFAGGDFEKKRNRLKKFLKNYPEVQIAVYKPQDNQEILAFAENIFKDNLQIPVTSLDVLKRGLQSELFQGFIIKLGHKIAGLLLYSELNLRSVIVHFELADSQFDGLTQFMNNYLGKTLLGKYIFINREQDLGIAGLRKSKLSYRPYRLLKKYTAIYKF